MHRLFIRFAVVSALVIGTVSRGTADEPVTLANVTDPGENRVDEPLISDYSPVMAARFLDAASLTWQKERKCFTCHTNFAYLYARPSIPGHSVAHDQVRAYAEELVTTRWVESGPRWDAEVVAAAAALAFNDSATTGTLHAATRTALDRMWTLQQENGGWDWLKCDWPPMESDDHYGVTLAAIAAGVAPDDYRASKSAVDGLAGIRRYLKQNPAPTLHHEAMLVWADSYGTNLLTDEERSATVEKLRRIQKSDGGWALATLGDWQRADDSEQDMINSDGYATGFVIYVLRRAREPVTSDAVRRGAEWLKKHQRESGRWFTRSLYKDSRHFISHAGTAMAVMALHACESTEISQRTAD